MKNNIRRRKTTFAQKIVGFLFVGKENGTETLRTVERLSQSSMQEKHANKTHSYPRVQSTHHTTQI